MSLPEPITRKEQYLKAIAEGSGGGGGGSYTLPIASATRLGGIKVGDNLSIDGNGVLSAQTGGSITVYEKEITTSQYGWWIIEDEEGNKLNADEYIVLSVNFVRRSSDGENSNSYLDCAWQIDTATSPVSYPTYAMTFCRTNDGSVYVRESMTKKVRVVYVKKEG